MHQAPRRVVEEALQRLGCDRSSLIAVLQEVQSRIGFLPREALEEIADRMKIPLSAVYGVATFYAQFKLKAAGRHVIKICHGTACHVAGAPLISEAVCSELDVKEGETTEDGMFTVERVACLGCCSLAPVMVVDGVIYGRMSPVKARTLVKRLKERADREG